MLLSPQMQHGGIIQKLRKTTFAYSTLGERCSLNAGLDLAASVISSGSIFFLTSSVAERLQACDFVKTCWVESWN
ncbi:MAG: hypothetical protein ACP5RH_05700 [Leptodesmis sp.]